MELIQFIISSFKGEMCFLCFKEAVNSQNIQSNLEIESEMFNKSLSLSDMMHYLFPSFELTLNKSCEDCANLIIRMYIQFQRNEVMKTIIKSIIGTINKEVNENSNSNYGQLDVNLNLSKIMDVNKPELKFSKKYDISNTIEDNFEDATPNALCEQSQENQCPECFKLFHCVKKYKSHMKSHKRNRKKVYYNCVNCSYKSLCKESLQGHINKKHLKIRPHICSICYKDFYHKKNLIEHSRRHSEVRNEICEICGDSFIHKKNLLEHLKLHSGERPYLCEVCDQRFVTSGRRLEHIKRCHSQKTECCLICDKKFGLIKELTRHIKAVHS